MSPSVSSSNYGQVTANAVSRLDKKFVIPAEEPIIGYKGFKLKDGKLMCRDMVYEKGMTYVLSGKVEVCYNGFHFCEELTKVFQYYNWQTGEEDFLSNKKGPSTGTNENHVYYKVKGWGDADRDHDKLAVQYMEVLEKVDENELFEAKLKPWMDDVDYILNANENVIIAGSLALMLKKEIPVRPVGDLDMTAPYFVEFNNGKKVANFGKSGEETIQMQVGPVFFDLFINPYNTWEYVYYAKKKYKVSESKPIMEAKFRYFLKGKHKHGQDILDFVKNQI